jgi:Na+/proline symporter
MLIPIGVIVYTMFGGLKATYLSSLLSSWFIFVMVVTFSFAVYASNDAVLGSPSKVWNNLNTYVATPAPTSLNDDVLRMRLGPAKDNLNGSFMTMYSRGGIIFGMINTIGNFGTVFVDQSYFTAAIAARPSASWKGYLLGGAMWFTIPFTLATSLGLASRAAGLPISAIEASSGLVAPAAAIYLMKGPGAWLMVLTVLMAVTSTCASLHTGVP